jgi:hypothetical protein
MKITKNQFKKIIQEELSAVLGEADETQHWEVDASPIGGGKITVPTRDQEKTGPPQNDASSVYYDYEAKTAKQAVELMLLHYLSPKSNELTDEQKVEIAGTDEDLGYFPIYDKIFSVKDATGKESNANASPIEGDDDESQENELWGVLNYISSRARHAAQAAEKAATSWPAAGYPPIKEGMKITKTKLKQIIQEELSAVLEEEELSEIAKFLNDPDEGSPNWCKKEVDHYQHLLNQEKDLQKKNRFFPGDEHTEALEQKVADQLKKLESAPCGAELQAMQEGTKQMKITKTKLKQIIQEELSAVLGEDQVDCAALQQKLAAARIDLQQVAMSRRSDHNAAGSLATLIKDLEAKMEDNGCPKEVAPTTDKKPGGHTFSSDKAGSQQAALDSWRPGE